MSEIVICEICEKPTNKARKCDECKDRSIRMGKEIKKRIKSKNQHDHHDKGDDEHIFTNGELEGEGEDGFDWFEKVF